MKRLAIAVALAALAIPAMGQAGGWATVTLAPPPAGLEADEAWTARFTVLRHGVTPTDGAEPSITIWGAEGISQTFPARPTGTTGEYLATVVFPTAGSWDYEVSDGLGATGDGASTTHTYAAVEIAPGTGGGGGLPVWPFVLAATALAGVGAAFLLARQRSRRLAHQG